MNHVVPRLPPEGERVREFDPAEHYCAPGRLVSLAPGGASRRGVRIPNWIARRLFRDFDPVYGRATLEVRWPRCR